MYSQPNRPFSQQESFSQLTFGSQKQANNNEGVAKNSHLSSGLQDYSQDCIRDASLAPNADGPEEEFSARADAIYKENRQIRQSFEKSLKELEKKRLKLTSRIENIKEERHNLSIIHERQIQQSVKLQMELEKWDENYQNELKHRQRSLESLKQIQEVVNIFEGFYTEGVRISDEVKEATRLTNLKFEMIQAEESAIEKKKNDMKLLFNSEKEVIIQNFQEQRGSIMKERKESIIKIQDLTTQQFSCTNKIKSLQEEIGHKIKRKEDCINTINNLNDQNKQYTDEISKVNEHLDELRTVGWTSVQNMRLQLVTEQNNNANLETHLKNKEDCSNNTLTKERELGHLSSQMKMAIEEKGKQNEMLHKKIKDCQERKDAFIQQSKSLLEGIENNRHAGDINKSYKNKISELNEVNQSNNAALKEKEAEIAKINKELEDTKNLQAGLNEKISLLDSELRGIKSHRDDLTLKMATNKHQCQQERESKTSRNKSTEQTTLEVVEKVKMYNLNLQQVQDFNSQLDTEKKELETTINTFEKKTEGSIKQVLDIETQYQEQFKNLEDDIEMKYNILEEYETLLNKMKPKLDELPIVTEKKNSLEKQVFDEEKTYIKEKDVLENNFKSKMLELDIEMDKYPAIMKKLFIADEEASEKIKKDIKVAEEAKMKHEEEIQILYQRLHAMKNNEMIKRAKIAKMEKSLRTINKEIKDIRHDIITSSAPGKNQVSVKPIASPIKQFDSLKKDEARINLMTPVSLQGSRQTSVEPPMKKVAVSKNLVITNKNSKLGNLNKWAEPVPWDEYEFSEV